MRFGFATLFPETVRNAFADSILGRAVARGLIAIEVVNPRDFAYDRHAKVDDRPFGGAPGMLLKAEPVALALERLQSIGFRRFVAPDPTGRVFAQSVAREWATEGDLAFVCGHYEGVDQRVLDAFDVEPISLGDFVVTNGELPAVLMADAVARCVPGVLGDAGSLAEDSFSGRALAAPNYTRPAVWRGRAVPSVLLSGDHARATRYQEEVSERITRERRPDLA